MKATFRETFQAEPISLAIINEQFERCAGAIPEDEESSGDRILIEACFAEGDERINPRDLSLVAGQNYNPLNYLTSVIY
jgi:hypothetical protein